MNAAEVCRTMTCGKRDLILRHFDAARVRQLHIEKHQIRHFGRCHGKRLTPEARIGHRVAVPPE
jgi:hypothetical protein